MVVDLNVMTATGSCTWCEGRAIQQFADDTALTIIDRRADQIAAHVTHIFIVAAHIITAEESIMCMQHTLQRWHSWRRLAQPCSTWQSLSTKVLGPQQKQRCRTAAGRTPCVKWRETLPSQEESAGRDIPMKQLVTKVLVSRGSPLPPCQH